jgi:hypothetical protein
LPLIECIHSYGGHNNAIHLAISGESDGELRVLAGSLFERFRFKISTTLSRKRTPLLERRFARSDSLIGLGRAFAAASWISIFRDVIIPRR